jgi:hypothetical protein
MASTSSLHSASSGSIPLVNEVVVNGIAGAIATASAAVLAAKPKASYLSREQIQFWLENGCLAIKAKDIWSDEELKALIDGVNMMDSWQDTPGHWMKVRHPQDRHGRLADLKTNEWLSLVVVDDSIMRTKQW